MFFIGLLVILVAVYSWNFRILQTINEYQKSTQQGKLVRNLFEVWMRNAVGASDILVRLFLQSLHYTCFSSTICPLQVPALNLLIQFARCKFEVFWVKFVGIRPSRIYY